MLSTIQKRAHLLRILDRNSRCIRKELVQGLEKVLYNNLDEVEAFSRHNIDLKTQPLDRVRFPLHPSMIAFYVSATFIANAAYFEYSIPHAEETIYLSFPQRNGRATHNEIGNHKHLIRIPRRYFRTGEQLLFALDAETRHAVHQGIQQKQGIQFRQSAARSAQVIAEAIDEGLAKPNYYPPMGEGILDPYLNDYFMYNEHDGHAGAQHLLRFLHPNPVAQQRQLYWLSRIPLRQGHPQTYEFVQLLSRFRGLSFTNTEGIPTSEKQVIFVLGTPYLEGLEPLIDFYERTKRPHPPNSDGLTLLNPKTMEALQQFDSSTHSLKKVASAIWQSNTNQTPQILEILYEARRFALTHFPYTPPCNDTVILRGKTIPTFASQLDYIALKLVTVKPLELYNQARQWEEQRIQS